MRSFTFISVEHKFVVLMESFNLNLPVNFHVQVSLIVQMLIEFNDQLGLQVLNLIIQSDSCVHYACAL